MVASWHRWHGASPALREILAREGVTDPLWYEVKKSRRAPEAARTFVAAACLRWRTPSRPGAAACPAPPTAATCGGPAADPDRGVIGSGKTTTPNASGTGERFTVKTGAGFGEGAADHPIRTSRVDELRDRPLSPG